MTKTGAKLLIEGEARAFEEHGLVLLEGERRTHEGSNFQYIPILYPATGALGWKGCKIHYGEDGIGTHMDIFYEFDNGFKIPVCTLYRKPRKDVAV